MDASAVTTLVSSMGFPIVMCLLLFKYIAEEGKATRETLSALESAIKTLERGVNNLIQITTARLNSEKGYDSDEI